MLGAAVVTAGLAWWDRGRRIGRMAAHHRAAAQRARAHVHALVDQATDAIAVVDADLTIRACSPAAARILGYERTSPIGMRPIELVHADDRAAVAAFYSETLARPGTSASATYRIASSTLDPAEVEVRADNLLDEPHVGGLLLRLRAATTAGSSADRDPVSLATRTLFVDLLADMLESGESVGVIAIGFHDLAELHATFGQSVADHVVAAAAARVLEEMPDDAAVALTDAGHPVVAIPGVADHAAVLAMARRLVSKLREAVSLDDDSSVVVTSSAGVTCSAGRRLEADTVLRHAEIALHAAIASGPDRVEVFEPSMFERVAARTRIAQALIRAPARGELELHYQPVFEIASGRMAGVEALVRWNHPVLGTVSPSEFVPVAEAAGLAGHLGDWVLGEACRQLRSWRDEHPAADDLVVAVNVAPAQLGDATLIRRLDQILHTYGVTGRDLCIEITESALACDVSSTVADLDELGVSLAIDDFGTGFSSLSRLRDLPFATLKIDRSFVSPDGGVPENQHLLASIIGIAHGLGMNVIAEGVETAEQLRLLHELGCEHAQGYLLGRPVPATALSPGLERAPVPHDVAMLATTSPVARSIADALASTSDGDDVVHSLLREMARATGCEVTYLTTVDWATRMLTVSSLYAAGDGPSPGRTTHWAASASCAAITAHRPDVRSSPHIEAETGLRDLATVIVAPVIVETGTMVGTLCAATARSEVDVPTVEAVIDQFARVVAERLDDRKPAVV